MFATGFKAGGSVKDTGTGPGKVGYEVTGRGGVTMTDKWKDGTMNITKIGLCILTSSLGQVEEWYEALRPSFLPPLTY